MLLTSEEVVFQASLLHVFVNKEVFFVFPTIAEELNQVGMREFPQEFYLRLYPQINTCNQLQHYQYIDSLLSYNLVFSLCFCGTSPLFVS